MLKNILNLGTNLDKSKQQSINGGNHPPYCTKHSECPSGARCVGWACY